MKNLLPGKCTKSRSHLSGSVHVLLIGVVVSAALSTAFAQPINGGEARNQEMWRQAIAQREVPAQGCFHASYPSLEWTKVDCRVAPNIPFLPRTGPQGHRTVGNGNDYAAEVTSGLISKTIGSFTKVKGVTTETGSLGANDYSLQINSNLMNTAICDGARNPVKCQAWEQFVYSSGYETAFMQYWLIAWNKACPIGWGGYKNDCFTNSAAVAVPQVDITQLETLKLSASAQNGGIDTLLLTAGTEAYATTASDSVVDLATGWTESEFNIFGDGGSSEAEFNSGSSLTVKVAVSNGTRNAPTCASGAGTTAETNNLTLGSCASMDGARPFIKFVESN